MPRNDHKKVILQLSEAYQNVYKEDTEMEFDERGFAKNTEAGLERQDNIEYSKHHSEEKEFKSELKFKEGQYVYGKNGLEIISDIDEQGVITTYKMEEGHRYKPGTEEYEELDDYDEYVKYARMTDYRPAYGEY
tara:strand:- start:70 stop:471 length:402 start_codon:yes stop_codon:yes gene_type:complete